MLTSSTYPDPDTLAAAVTERERPALAKALNLLDDKRPEARRRAARLLRLLPHERLYASGHLIGLTGPPGAGKSSLTAALITIWRKRGLRVAVLAVDPSSPISGGALHVPSWLLGAGLVMARQSADGHAAWWGRIGALAMAASGATP